MLDLMMQLTDNCRKNKNTSCCVVSLKNIIKTI